MSELKKMKLVLPDGRQICGMNAGADVCVCGELVFNTSMVGYQEVISDPAYAGQIIVMTYPLIGQYGIMDEDFESKSPSAAGLIVRECCDTPSNFRYTQTLPEYLQEHDIPCLEGVDTRMLTTIIREEGNMRAALVPEDMPLDEALAMLSAWTPDDRAAAKASCTKRWFSRTAQHIHDVVIVDCGLKNGIVKALNRRGCNVTVVPFGSTAEEILAFNPDGVLISSGPGNPADAMAVVDVINQLKGKLPVFGIGLGHALIALSYDAQVERLKAGHHGGHPVRPVGSLRIVTAEHNHNYTVVEASLAATPLSVTYHDAADGTVEGIECAADKVYAVQFYPEGGPGPEETDFFDRFVKMIKLCRAEQI